MSENKDKDVEEFEEKPTKVEVTIKDKDGKKSREKELEEQLEQARIEAEDYKSKLELVAQLEFERRRKLADAPENIQTPEQLEGFITGKTGKKPEPAGVIPLSPAQLGLQDKEPEYIPDDMMAYLHNLEKKGSDEEKIFAKKAIDNLILKSMANLKKGEVTPEDTGIKPEFQIRKRKKKVE